MARLSESETKSAHSSTQGTNFIGDFKINRLRIFTPQRDRGSFIEFGDGEGAVWTDPERRLAQDGESSSRAAHDSVRGSSRVRVAAHRHQGPRHRRSG